MMDCKYYFVSESKLGNAIDENEDAIGYPDDEQSKDSRQLFFSIADGATESSYSREWASFLVKAYSKKAFNKKEGQGIIELLSQEWQSLLANKSLPWYAYEKAEAGAFATFLGVAFFPDVSFWTAMAIGDCNLMQMRNNEVIRLFPISDVRAFSNTPHLLCSKPQKNKYEQLFQTMCGPLCQGDSFILATDAMAAWLLKNMEQAPFDELTRLVITDNKDGFVEWLSEKRQSKEIKNDDTSLLLIKFD